MDHQNPILDLEKEQLIQKMDELQQQLEKTKREKRNLLDEVNSLKIEKKQQKKSQQSYITPGTNQYNQTSQKYRNDILNLVENEITSFSQFANDISSQQFTVEELQESFETINQISSDSHLRMEEKIQPFFAAIRSLVLSCLSQSQTLHIQDLGNSNTMASNDSYKLQMQLNQIKSTAKALKKQITSEHKMIANFAKNFDPSATSIVDDESFVQSELKILSDSMIVDYSKFRDLIERDFGQLENDQITLPDLLEYSFSKFQEVDDFIQKLYAALEIDPNENNYDTVLNSLQQHLSIIPKLQNSTSQLKRENEILQNHCTEMEQIIQKQSQDYNKSHKAIVQKLQDQIKDLQKRSFPNDSRLEEITQILSDKDEESQLLAKRVKELEEAEIKQKEKITELNLDLSRQTRQYEDLNTTYQLSLRKLKEEQKLTSELKTIAQQKEMKIKELEEDLNGQIEELTITNAKLRHTAEEEQKTEIDELRTLTEKSINELQKVKKKSKKYQNLLQTSENSRKELETKITELTGIQEEQNIRITELQSRLKHSKVTLTQISDEYKTFQQEHLRAVSKLSEYQSRVKKLTTQNELLTNQLSESQSNIEMIENSTCSKKELEKCFVEIQNNQKTIRELKSIVNRQNSTISAYESRQPVLEQFKDKYSEEHENLRLKNSFVLNVTSIVKDIHYYLTMIFQNRPNASPTLIEIIQKMKPLFNAFQLPLFSFDFVKKNAFNFMSCRVVNLRPNPECEVVSQDHRILLARISDELTEMQFNQNSVFSSLSTMSNLSDRLRNILELVVSVKKAFDEKNDSLNSLTSLIKNQHSAIVRMSYNSPTGK